MQKVAELNLAAPEFAGRVIVPILDFFPMQFLLTSKALEAHRTFLFA
jgi:hypothetical protein